MINTKRILDLSLLIVTSVVLVGCGSPRSTAVDDGLMVQSSSDLKASNDLEECPDLNGTFHRKDGVNASRTMLIGKTSSGVAKMSMEKKNASASAVVDGYTIDGARHFSRQEQAQTGVRTFDYIAICKAGALRVSIFEAKRNIHNILYIRTLEGFDIQQRGEFGESLTQWLPTK